MATRIERLASNSTMYYRGDSCLEISPFTNYYLFTIYRESNDETVDDHIPLNLTNLGTLWLSFMDGETKIRVPNYTEADNIDMANGEVVFRISAEDASRILNTSNRKFYISSAISDGNTSSDETVLFSGSWSEYSSAMKSALTDTVQEYKNKVYELEAKIAEDTNEWTKQLDEANSTIEKLKAENERLNALILDLENKLASIDSNYIEATIVEDITSIPHAVSTEMKDNKTSSQLDINAQKLEKTMLKSSFKYDDSSIAKKNDNILNQYSL